MLIRYFIYAAILLIALFFAFWNIRKLRDVPEVEERKTKRLKVVDGTLRPRETDKLTEATNLALSIDRLSVSHGAFSAITRERLLDLAIDRTTADSILDELNVPKNELLFEYDELSNELKKRYGLTG